MENSVADIELSQEGHTVWPAEPPGFYPPALSSSVPPALVSMRSSKFKVSVLLFVIVLALTRDVKISLAVLLANIILTSVFK